MNDEIVLVIKEFLDDRTQFNFLNYYYQKMLQETDDYDEYGYKLECLNEWRMHTEHEWDVESDSDRYDWIEEEILIGLPSDYSDTSSEHYNPDSEPDN